MLLIKRPNSLSPRGFALLLLVISVLTELCLSNAYGVYNRLFRQEDRYFRADLSNSEHQENLLEDGSYRIDSKHTTLTVSSLPSAIHSVSFSLRYAHPTSEAALSYVEVGGCDENLSRDYIVYATQTLRVGNQVPEQNRIRIASHGTPSFVELYFDTEEELVISDIRFNAPEGFSFSFLRWGVLVFLAALLWLGKTFALSKRILDFHSHSGKCLLAALLIFATLISVLVGIFLMGPRSFSPVSYPLSAPTQYYSPYVQQFDAFQKGQVHLDLKVSDELKTLENPYDTSLREDVDYPWDRAYYNGKYYSYFGIAPILVLSYPCYLLFGCLPSDGTLLTIFSALAGIFMILCLWEICKQTGKKLSYTHFLLGSAACLAASLVWQMQRGVDRFYYVAGLSATAFGMMAIYFFLKALPSPKALPRRLWLAGAGAAFGLTMLSRINSALLYGLVILGLLIYYCFRRIRSPLSLSADLAAPAILVLGTMGFLLYFNALRFGNPLEFGARYQLTVSNVAYNQMGPENLLPSLYHYFLEPLVWDIQFPFLHFASHSLSSYGHYVYLTNTNAGLFAFPLLWALFAFGALWKKRSLPKAYRRICLAVLIGFVPFAFLSYSLGGSILRYVADLSPLASLLSVLILLELCDGAGFPAPNHSERFVLSGAKWLCIATLFVGFCLLCINDNGNFGAYSPKIYSLLESIFIF